VGPRAGLDEVVKIKIPSPRRDTNPRSSCTYPSAIPLVEVKIHFKGPYHLLSDGIKENQENPGIEEPTMGSNLRPPNVKQEEADRDSTRGHI
jgi:hypothetical protein